MGIKEAGDGREVGVGDNAAETLFKKRGARTTSGRGTRAKKTKNDKPVAKGAVKELRNSSEPPRGPGGLQFS